jgi:hypothetical protein
MRSSFSLACLPCVKFMLVWATRSVRADGWMGGIGLVKNPLTLGTKLRMFSYRLPGVVNRRFLVELSV